MIRVPGFAALAVAIATLGLAVPAGPADLDYVTVKLVDKRYQLESRAWFDASEEDLFRVLTDYDLFTKFTSAIAEARNVEPDDLGRPQFYTRMEGCVLWWCKSLIRQGYLELTPTTLVIAMTDPESSNFKYSRESWKLVRDGEKTVMTYNFEMEPDFFVPPIIGPYMIKRSLKSGGRDAVDRIEALAQGKEPEL